MTRLTRVIFLRARPQTLPLSLLVFSSYYLWHQSPTPAFRYCLASCEVEWKSSILCCDSYPNDLNFECLLSTHQLLIDSWIRLEISLLRLRPGKHLDIEPALDHSIALLLFVLVMASHGHDSSSIELHDQITHPRHKTDEPSPLRIIKRKQYYDHGRKPRQASVSTDDSGASCQEPDRIDRRLTVMKRRGKTYRWDAVSKVFAIPRTIGHAPSKPEQHGQYQSDWLS